MIGFMQFLTENEARVEALRALFVPRFVAADPSHSQDFWNRKFDIIVQVDPTPQKVYLQWLCLRVEPFVKNKDFGRFVEDSVGYTQDLVDFNRVKGRMPADMRDIGKFKTFGQLRDAIQPYLETKSANELKREEISKFKAEITVVYDGPDGQIFIPNTWKSSQYLGRGTKWCTAMTTTSKWFKQYSKDGPLYCFIHKDGRKWQMHIESMQFMDELDSPLPNGAVAGSPLWKHVERRIFSYVKANPKHLMAYVKMIGASSSTVLPDVEEIIANSADENVVYSYTVSRQLTRFIPGTERAFEKLMDITNPGFITQSNTLKHVIFDIIGRVRPLENYILKNSNAAIAYYETKFKRGERWMEFENSNAIKFSLAKKAYEAHLGHTI